MRAIWLTYRENLLNPGSMKELKYKVITSEKQYDSYCNTLESLLAEASESRRIKEEIALLTLLIEKWDEEHTIFHKLDPVQLLKSLMEDHRIKAVELAAYLDVSKSLVSDILHYRKGMSKDVIRRLASRFKMNQEAFNRPYQLKSAARASQARPAAQNQF